MAHRSNLSTRALYNCIIFLNQLRLKKEEPSEVSDNKGKSKEVSLPVSLINTYFRIFEVAVNKTKPKDPKDKKTSQTDAAMKSRLLGALLTGVNRAHPYLPSNDTGMEEHIDSLYRIAHVSPPSACTQALMLLFHLAVGSKENIQSGSSSKSNSDARQDRFYRALYSKLSDPHMLFGKQLTLFFNLVYKSMKNDSNSNRVVAFGKRLLHVSFHYNAAVTSGALFLVSEVMKFQPSLAASVLNLDGHRILFDPQKRDPSSSFNTVMDPSTNSDNLIDVTQANVAGSLWEISLTSHHYHPSVCKFSTTLGDITYNGDPLRDFSLAPFLDKFAFRNPKSTEKIKEKHQRGEGIGKRRSGLQGEISAMSSLPVNDPDFWKKQNAVPEQEEFFRKFFNERARRDEVKGISRGKNRDEDVVDAVLDAAEAKVEDVTFDWVSDEEEEEFVQNLAESLMRSSGEKINFDDEDPDMDDWSGYSSNHEDKEIADKSGFDSDLYGFDDSSIDSDVSIASDDESEDQQQNSVSESEDANIPEIDSVEDEQIISNDDDFGNHSEDASENDSDADDFILDLAEDSDADEESNENGSVPAHETTDTKKSTVAFADAEEFEEIMFNAWANERSGNKRPTETVNNAQNKSKKPRKSKK